MNKRHIDNDIIDILRKHSDSGIIDRSRKPSALLMEDDLGDVSNIEEEVFEVSELPREKTRVMWIFNSVSFIERVTQNNEGLGVREFET